MFIRVISYRVKSDSLGQFEQVMNSVRDQLATIDGMQRCIAAVDDSGKAVVVGIWDDEDAATKGNPQTQKVWASLSEHIVEPPKTVAYKSAFYLKG